MKVINQKQTESLLNGLENVSIENIDTYLQHKGVIVEVSVGRKRMPVSLDPKVYGVDVNTNEEVATFFKEHIKKSKLLFIPKTYEKKLQSIESFIRLKRNSMAIGYDNKYILLEDYHKFMEIFNKKKEEYFNILEEITCNWDSMVINFKNQLDIIFDSLNSLDKGKIQAQIWSKVPTVEEYKESFYFKVKLKAFPVMSNVSIFDSEIAEQVKERAIEENILAVQDIISNTLNDTFGVLSDAYTFYNNNADLSVIQLSKLGKLVPNLQKNNLLRNEFIMEIINDLKENNSIPDIDKKIEQIEVILGKIYKFSKELGLEQNLPLNKCPLSIDILEDYIDIL